MMKKTFMGGHKEDNSISASIYNPKEFRSRPGGAAAGGNRRVVTPPASVVVGIPTGGGFRLFLVCIVIAAAGYAFLNWTMESPSGPRFSLLATGVQQRLHPSQPGMIYAPLKIIGDTRGRHCLIELMGWQGGGSVLTVFVRKGEAIETSVPVGLYRAEVSCGTTWSGTYHHPGSDFDRFEFANPLSFTRENGRVTGMTISLTKRLGGNAAIRKKQ